MTSRGFFIKSDNILYEHDPEKIRWETLPDGDEGLRAPKGPVSDETNLVPMNDGSLYCTYRTIDGYMCHAYSRDGGHTWTPPAYATYAPGGRRIKHNRAYCPVWKLSNGKYLLWFNNHGGKATHSTPKSYYSGRNPVWIAGGVEKNGFLHWTEPEIFMYDTDLRKNKGMATGISYPDLLEVDREVYMTETQKTIARVHKIDTVFLQALWEQFDVRQEARRGLVLKLENEQLKPGSRVEMPVLPELGHGGFTVDFRIRLDHLSKGQVILDTRDENGKGLVLETTGRSTIALSLSDGEHQFTWDSDPGTHPGTLMAGKWQHVGVVVDGLSKVISFVVNGKLNDGGAVREYGFGRLPPELKDINGDPNATLARDLSGELKVLRIYDRHLMTTELIGNSR